MPETYSQLIQGFFSIFLGGMAKLVRGDRWYVASMEQLEEGEGFGIRFPALQSPNRLQSKTGKTMDPLTS